MAIALSNSSLQRVNSLLKQWEATHGRKATPDIVRGLMESELSTAAARSLEQQRINLERDRFKEQQQRYEEQQKQNERAATVAGIRDIANTGIGGYMAYKQFTAPATKAPTVAPQTSALGAQETSPAVTTNPPTNTPTPAASTTSAAIPSSPQAIPVYTGPGQLATGAIAQQGTTVGTATSEAIPTYAGPQSLAATGSEATGGTTGGGSSAGAGVGSGIAAAVIADALVARGAHGPFQSMEERMRNNAKGFEYGGVSPGAAALFQKFGIKSPLDITKDITGIDIGGTLMDIQDTIINATVPDFVNDFASSLGF